MPRKPKTTDSAQPAEATPGEPKGTKTAAVKAALRAHRDKQPKEIAELLQAEGWDVKAQYVSTVKSKLSSGKKAKRAASPAEPKKAPAKAPAAPKAGDAISLDALKKAKELAAQLGGVNNAKAALAALSELLG